jgi:hypothetical protein
MAGLLSSMMQDSGEAGAAAGVLHQRHTPHRLGGAVHGDDLEELGPLDALLEVASDGGASWEDMDEALQLLEEAEEGEGEQEAQGVGGVASMPHQGHGLQRQWSSTRGASSSGTALLGMGLPPLEEEPAAEEPGDELLLLELPGCGGEKGPATDPIADSLVALDRQVIATATLLRQRSGGLSSGVSGDGSCGSKCATSTTSCSDSGQLGSDGSGGDLPSEEELLQAPPLDEAARRWGDSLLAESPVPVRAGSKRGREGQPGYWTTLLNEEGEAGRACPAPRKPRMATPPAAAAAAPAAVAAGR